MQTFGCKAVCAHYVVEFHRNHTIKTVINEYETRKNKMQSDYHAAKSKFKTAKRALENLHDKIALITQIGGNGKTSLEEQAKQGTNYITDFEKKIKEESG